MNNLAILQALAFEPGKAFSELDARPRFWFALLVLVLSTVVMTGWYTSVVDLEWLIDQQLRASSAAANMTDEQLAQLASNAAGSRGVRVVVGACLTGIVVSIVLLLYAVYYLLAGKVTGVERSFRHWMALSSWSSIPGALVIIPAAIVLLTATSNQISQTALQPLSLNDLLVHREAGEPGYTLFNSINLFQLLSLYLAAFGIKTWSGRSWLFGIVFAALPFVVIYGIWALIALR